MPEKAKQRPALEEAGGAPPSYFRLSRSWPASLLFIAPLVVLYEAGATMLRGDANAMAEVTRGPLFVFGERADMAFSVVVVAVLLYAVLRLVKWRALRWSVFPVMFVESALYAMLLVPLASLVYSGKLQMATADFASLGWPRMAAAAGAGVYEELLFRGVLLAAMYWVCVNVLKMKAALGVLLAVLVSSALFSAWHFVGGIVEPGWPDFRFRFVAGVFLGFVFLARGLGIAAFAHAIYNVWCA